jgi:nucleotide-binding universal stress UspA family protein
MRAFRNILVFTRGTGALEAGVANAIALARRNKARLRLIDVLIDLPPGWRRLAVEINIGDLKEHAERQRRAELESLAGGLREDGLRVTTGVFWGKPFREIICDVLRHDIDLVIHTGTRAEGLDSTGMHLMRKCPVPVWVSLTAEHTDAPRILAAVDPTLHERVRNQFDIAVTRLAHDCAEALGGELHVVHAWQPITELVSTVGAARDRRLQRFVADTGKRHEKWLAELLHDAGVCIPASQVHIVRGNPAQVANEVAHEIGADLLVIGTVRRPDVEGLFIGQTAEEILERVRVPVLAMKPEGFVSPVTVSEKEMGNPTAVGN